MISERRERVRETGQRFLERGERERDELTDDEDEEEGRKVAILLFSLSASLLTHSLCDCLSS